jgi:hypothetical protein
LHYTPAAKRPLSKSNNPQQKLNIEIFAIISDMFLVAIAIALIGYTILFFVIFLLPILLTLALVAKLYHVRRFRLDRMSLWLMIVLWLVSIGFTTYRFISPSVSNNNSKNMELTQVDLWIQKTTYPLLLSSNPSVTYELTDLTWSMFWGSGPDLSEHPLVTTDPYFQPAKGLCDLQSLTTHQQTNNLNSNYVQCHQLASLSNGMVLYQLNGGGYGSIIGIYRNLLLEYGGNAVNKSLLNSIYIAPKSAVVSVTHTNQYNSIYDDALNRWYNQQVNHRCYVAENDCPFSL